MKRLMIGCFACVALASGSAMAADMSAPAPAPVYKSAPVPSPYNWTGFYLGVEGGWRLGPCGADRLASVRQRQIQYLGLADRRHDGLELAIQSGRVRPRG
jgi:hypothetical protein